jgi:hypothetical protein
VQAGAEALGISSIFIFLTFQVHPFPAFLAATNFVEYAITDEKPERNVFCIILRGVVVRMYLL